MKKLFLALALFTMPVIGQEPTNLRELVTQQGNKKEQEEKPAEEKKKSTLEGIVNGTIVAVGAIAYLIFFGAKDEPWVSHRDRR